MEASPLWILTTPRPTGFLPRGAHPTPARDMRLLHVTCGAGATLTTEGRPAQQLLLGTANTGFLLPPSRPSFLLGGWLSLHKQLPDPVL